jgi:hypothetical protein
MLTQRDGLLGWATGRLIDHDTLAPGAIRRLLSNGPARRQAVFALVAVEVAADTQHDQAAAIRRAEIVRDGGARQVLAEALGREPPNGLRGALERIGSSPLREPRLYHRLIEIYSDSEHRVAAEALRYVGQITGGMVNVLEVLPTALVHSNVLKNLVSEKDARSFIEAVRFAKFVNTRATDEAIIYAVAHMKAGKGLDDILARFVRRADRQLGVPLVADDEVRPVVRVRDMIFAARKFRNCLSMDRKIVGSLLGRAAYAIFRDEVVMEFVYLTTGTWLFVDAHAMINGLVPNELEAAVRAKCVAGGVATVPQSRGQPGRFSRFSDHYEPRFLNLEG